jgi:hypothetical protein
VRQFRDKKVGSEYCFDNLKKMKSSVFLALVSSDSTCVFYQITQGLNQPVDTSARHSKLNRQEKLDADIRKHKNLITEAALCGMSITIRDQKN